MFDFEIVCGAGRARVACLLFLVPYGTTVLCRSMETVCGSFDRQP